MSCPECGNGQRAGQARRCGYCGGTKAPAQSGRTGRPPIPAYLRRTARLPIMLTGEERSMLDAAAELAGVEVSAYVREAALGRAARTRT